MTSAPASACAATYTRELLREPVEERVPHGRLAVHQRLRAREVATRLALHEIAGDRERAAAEADERAARRRARAARCGSPRGRSRPARTWRAARRRPCSAIGRSTTGPTPSTSSTPMPMPSTGDMMSAKRTAASTPCRRTGCSVTSAQSSGVPATLEEPWRSRIARYSGSERPAWRMNHTGVRSTGSRRAARTRRGSVTRSTLARCLRIRPPRRALAIARARARRGGRDFSSRR